MDKLPPEILQKIFIQLNLKERLVCLTICSRWWNVLDKGALFYSFTITDSNQFERFLHGFEQIPGRAAQVEEIYIYGLIYFDFITRKMFDTFTNIRKISAQRSFSVPDQAFPYINVFDYSKPKLEYLSDIDDCALLSRVLSLNLGSQLNTLNLDFENFQSCQNVVAKLRDLPVLKRLYIGRARLNVLDLEKIHENVPSIQNFALIDVSISASRIPSEIIPITFVTDLKFKRPRYADEETGAQMYRYMTRKYTNLSKIVHTDRVFRDDARNRFNPSQQRYIYLNGALDFLKMVGSKQSKLYLYYLPDDVDVFEPLDAGDSKLKFLCLKNCESKTTFQFLTQSNQAKYIEHLHIQETKIESIIPFESMVALTKLVIHCVSKYARPIHLEDCLSGCPLTLKSLTVRDKVIVPTSFSKKLNSVEYLSLGVVDITCNIGDFISNYFPNLLRLTLTGKVTEDVHLTLRNSNFQAADVRMHVPKRDWNFKYGFSFVSTNTTYTKYYVCSYQSMCQVDYVHTRSIPLFSIECFSDKKMEYHKGPIMNSYQ